MLFDPNRGRLPPPNLDDRTWSDLVNDVVALIPQYAKQWTNLGPADVGSDEPVIVQPGYWCDGNGCRHGVIPEARAQPCGRQPSVTTS